MGKVKEALMDYMEAEAAEGQDMETFSAGDRMGFEAYIRGTKNRTADVYQVFTATVTGLYAQDIFYNKEPSFEQIQKAELVLKNGVAIKNRQGPAR